MRINSNDIAKRKRPTSATPLLVVWVTALIALYPLALLLGEAVIGRTCRIAGADSEHGRERWSWVPPGSSCAYPDGRVDDPDWWRVWTIAFFFLAIVWLVVVRLKDRDRAQPTL